MSNIKNLQMGKTICNDTRISIVSSLFGLMTKATYIPTNSVIDARTMELSPSDGNTLLHILQSPAEQMAKLVSGFHPKSVPNGNYMAELCISRDGQFVAIQLLQYHNMNYEPVTDVLVYEGETAGIVRQMF